MPCISMPPTVGKLKELLLESVALASQILFVRKINLTIKKKTPANSLRKKLRVSSFTLKKVTKF